MTVNEIQEFAKIVQTVGGTSKEVFMLYFAKDIISSVLGFTGFMSALWAAYKLIRYLIGQNYYESEIMSSAGFDGSMTKGECHRICEWIKKGRSIN